MRQSGVFYNVLARSVVLHAGAIQLEPAFSVREPAAMGAPVFASRTSNKMGCLASASAACRDRAQTLAMSRPS